MTFETKRLRSIWQTTYLYDDRSASNVALHKYSTILR